MIALVNGAGGLDLAAGTTISLEIQNPLFKFDAVPGTTSYTFVIPWTPNNLRALNFPHVRAAQGERIAPELYGLVLDGVLWRQGSLVYKDCDEQKRVWNYTFAAGAADLQARIDGRTLRQLDLGRAALELRPDAELYALPMHHNPQFYTKNDSFSTGAGFLNDYRNGAYRLNAGGTWRFPLVPFLRLVPLLERVFGALGYRVSGEWLTDAADLVCYSDRAVEVLPPAPATVPILPADFALNAHVPDLGVGELLVALQKLFGLGFDFHPVRPEVRIVRLRDVVAEDAYVERTGGPARSVPAEYGGFLLKMSLEDEELNKTRDTSWAQLRVGNGKTSIDTVAGTLHLLGVLDKSDNSKRLVPAVLAKGASPAFEAGEDSRAGLRLLYDRGLRTYQGSTYPLATSASPGGGLPGLYWPGSDGLYAVSYQAWLDFLDRAGREERTMVFRVADLLSLDPLRKELVGGRKYLWEKVSVSVSTARRLESARFTYRPIRR
ncbi:hypothetical protein [Hymenobacter perfusus]|uniref:Uncharacterized protein n=1 Tax=Hymenobacter perfusus TaxID=1236770 RepID=A0A428KEA2_9BACT|nr:hypothetical protein [Hymenobacter perfusus]RSK44718.1 hypothetical protein EI293_09410 [Hymenobacter perfusus]